MTATFSKLTRKLFILAILVGGFLVAAPEQGVKAGEQCYPTFNTCIVYCGNLNGPYSATPDAGAHAACESGCWNSLGQCERTINPEERDE